MKIEQQFVVARPLPVVWAFFQDMPKVAGCMPGAEYLGQNADGKHLGRVTTKVGPFQTSFEGEADLTFDEAAKQVTSIGKGVDKKGASRGKMTILCKLLPEGQSTRVSVESDVQLSGAIAQFGRTGLLTEVAGVMIASFVQNAETELSPPPPDAAAAPPSAATAPAKQLDMASLILAALRGWFASIFRKPAKP